jgi:hypothetical protein
MQSSMRLRQNRVNNNVIAVVLVLGRAGTRTLLIDYVCMPTRLPPHLASTSITHSFSPSSINEFRPNTHGILKEAQQRRDRTLPGSKGQPSKTKERRKKAHSS